MHSLNVQPELALKVLDDALRKRDNELESLRKELSQLRHELYLTTAERDHLRSQTESNERQSELLRRKSSDDRSADETDFDTSIGQSLTPIVHDARIGRPKRLLVIGGGPAGLISLHELLNPRNRPQGHSLEGYDVHLYERRAEVGGVWYFEPENEIAKGWHHGAAGSETREDGPSAYGSSAIALRTAGDMELLGPEWATYTNGSSKRSKGEGPARPTTPTTNGVATSNGENHSHTNGHVSSSPSEDGDQDFCWLTEPHNAPRWPSAAYEGLVGNVLPPLLEFSAHRFSKPKGGLFPSMVETHQYLLQLAKPLRSHIKTCQEVLKVQPLCHEDSSTTWQVTKNDWSEDGHKQTSVEEWDGVIIAAGAFDHPFYPPDIPGLQPLIDAKSSLVMHAKTYPGPRPFLNQHNKIVVVGNANSANDIAAHLAPLNSNGPLYRCIRHPSNFAHLPDSRIKDVDPIANVKVSLDRATLHLTLEDGTQIEGVTKLIFASGYQYRFDWVKVPSPTDPSRKKLSPASVYGAVPNLHNATFVAAAPTLAFVGLSAGSTPMPLAEIQARNIARVFFGVSKLPESMTELLEDYSERAKELEIKDGDPTGWRQLHMVRGAPERKLTKLLLDTLEKWEQGASEGLFRWDDWRENVAKSMRAAKEKELRRLRDSKVAAGGVDGGIGGILSTSYGLTMGQKFNPVFGSTQNGRGKSLML